MICFKLSKVFLREFLVVGFIEYLFREEDAVLGSRVGVGCG